VDTKEHYQEALGAMNEEGASLTVIERNTTILSNILIANLEVLRVNPHYDSKGKLSSVDVWLLWQPLGFEEDGYHHSHLTRIVDWVGDDVSLTLTDDKERVHNFELLLIETESEAIRERLNWKKQLPPDYEDIRDELRQHFTRMADEWAEPDVADELEEAEAVGDRSP